MAHTQPLKRAATDPFLLVEPELAQGMDKSAFRFKIPFGTQNDPHMVQTRRAMGIVVNPDALCEVALSANPNPLTVHQPPQQQELF